MSLKQLYRTIRDSIITLLLAGRCRGYGPSTVPKTLRFMRLCRVHRYEPVEAFRLGIFRNGFDLDRLDGFLSRKNTTRLQESLNPPALAALFKNKTVFFQQCRIHGLPVPRLYGLFSFLGKTVHSYIGETMVPVTDKEGFAASLPNRFAIKPVEGSLGKGFRIITRKPDGFADHTGATYTTKAFYSLLAATSGIGTLMQEVIENHPDIVSLSGTTGLQTVRVITLVGADGHAGILTAFLKTITSPNIVIDTFIDGLKGNVEAAINPADGSLVEACYLDGSGKGIVVLDEHPVTRKPFKGFVIPYWPEVCELARSAASAALPVRAIGWDIAITAKGPYLIEGNIWWEPPNQHCVMGRIAQLMSAVISELADRGTGPASKNFRLSQSPIKELGINEQLF